jgi:uncharacterized protein
MPWSPSPRQVDDVDSTESPQSPESSGDGTENRDTNVEEPDNASTWWDSAVDSLYASRPRPQRMTTYKPFSPPPEAVAPVEIEQPVEEAVVSIPLDNVAQSTSRSMARFTCQFCLVTVAGLMLTPPFLAVCTTFYQRYQYNLRKRQGAQPGGETSANRSFMSNPISFLGGWWSRTFGIDPDSIYTFFPASKDTIRDGTGPAVYAGRIQHTRFQPTRHGFSYPFFIFGVPLLHEEEENSVNKRLWPLSWIVRWNSARDHLKNGEGLIEETSSPFANCLAQRLCRLISQRTNHQFVPNPENHSIFLLTHLQYYGYCFNPVSFYFVQDTKTQETLCVVAEVSNTPWNQMHCYVLHPDSTDVKQTRGSTTGSAVRDAGVWRYRFPKTFHVSPFMEMDYWYDWSFADFAWNGHSSLSSSIRITNGMKKIMPHEDRDYERLDVDDTDGDNEVEIGDPVEAPCHFLATLHLDRVGSHPMSVAYQMMRAPVYCAIVQIYIHYQALVLFWKNVPYQPHPTGMETAASKIIGTVMTPFFALQEFCQKSKGRNDERT